MKSEKLAATEARLDAKLEAQVDYARIALGFDLYSAFWANGYIKH